MSYFGRIIIKKNTIKHCVGNVEIIGSTLDIDFIIN